MSVVQQTASSQTHINTLTYADVSNRIESNRIESKQTGYDSGGDFERTGERHSTEIESYICHAFNRGGLVGIAFVDQEYPMRAAHSVVAKLIDEYMEATGAAWKVGP